MLLLLTVIIIIICNIINIIIIITTTSIIIISIGGRARAQLREGAPVAGGPALARRTGDSSINDNHNNHTTTTTTTTTTNNNDNNGNTKNIYTNYNNLNHNDAGVGQGGTLEFLREAPPRRAPAAFRGNHLSNTAGLTQVFLQQWRIIQQIMVILDTISSA